MEILPSQPALPPLLTGSGDFSFFRVKVNLDSPKIPVESYRVPKHLVLEHEVDASGNLLRQRKRHGKSRGGCASCKERRVKCDETLPSCHNCTRRGAQCNLRNRTQRQPPFKANSTTNHGTRVVSTKRSQSNQKVSWAAEIWEMDSSTASASTLTSSPHSPVSTGISVHAERKTSISQAFPFSPVYDMDAMRLLHHFCNFTANTLVFGSFFWREKVLPLALRPESSYLLHTILAVSSAHLGYLSAPGSIDGHKTAELRHLSPAFRGLRLALEAGILTTSSADDVIIASVLVFHHAWASASPTVESLGADHLLGLAEGVRIVFFTAKTLGGWKELRDRIPNNSISSVQHVGNKKYIWDTSEINRRINVSTSIFKDVILHRPSDTIKMYLHRGREKVASVEQDACNADVVKHDLLQWASHVWICREVEGGKSEAGHDEDLFNDFLDAAERLVLILEVLRLKPSCRSRSFSRSLSSELPSSTDEDEAGRYANSSHDEEGFNAIKPDLARLIFSWPLRNGSIFTSLLTGRSSAPAQAVYAATVLWLYFNLAARAHLLYDEDKDLAGDIPSPFWWSDLRTSQMLKMLFASVAQSKKINPTAGGAIKAGECHTCLGWARELAATMRISV